MAKKLDVPLSLVETTWPLFRFPASVGDDMLATMLEQEPWMAEKQNRAPRPREAITALIDASLWREAMALPLSYCAPSNDRLLFTMSR